MSEQFGFDEGLWDSCGVNGNQRAAGPGTELMNRTGHQLFSGAAFARNQHRRIRPGHRSDQGVNLPHRLAGAYQLSGARAILKLRNELPRFPPDFHIALGRSESGP